MDKIKMSLNKLYKKQYVEMMNKNEYHQFRQCAQNTALIELIIKDS